MAIVRNRTGQLSKSSVDSRKKKGQENELQSSTKSLLLLVTRLQLKIKLTNFRAAGLSIDLEYLISQLEDGCSLCGEVLHLVNLEDKTRHGLAYLFYIKCSCGNIIAVYTSQHHRNVDAKEKNMYNVSPFRRDSQVLFVRL